MIQDKIQPKGSGVPGNGNSNGNGKKEFASPTLAEKTASILQKSTAVAPPRRSTPVSMRRQVVEVDDVEEPDLKSKPYYSDEAMIKMINLLYDPIVATLCREAGIADEAQLLSLTKINSSREAWYWAQQIAKEAFYHRYNRDPNAPPMPKNYRRWPISKIQRVAFLLARRSLDMKAFQLGVGLANEQNIVKSEEGGEEDNW